MRPSRNLTLILGIAVLFCVCSTVYGSPYGGSAAFKGNIYNPGLLKPTDSELKVKVGDRAPDFTLPAVSGEEVSLGRYLGKKNVVLSFVPAAWTPVCSDQWPGYNIVKDIFDDNAAVLLGITVDNIPTLFAWTNQMVTGDSKLWFPVQAQDDRYHPKEPVLGVEVDGEFKAYPFVELGNTAGEVHDTLSGQGIVVTYDRRNHAASAAFVNGERLPAVTAFWFAWYAFHPDTGVYQAP